MDACETRFVDRIKELRRVPAKMLQKHPLNWREHPDKQLKALNAVIDEIGFAGAILARELPDGSLQVLDGHARIAIAGEETLPVLVLDLNATEAEKLLITFDPISELATSNAEKLSELLGNVTIENQFLTELLASIAQDNGLKDLLTSEESVEIDDEADETIPSGVRMVQLFLDEISIEIFQSYCNKLSSAYSSHNVTDTVMEALKRASALLQ